MDELRDLLFDDIVKKDGIIELQPYETASISVDNETDIQYTSTGDLIIEAEIELDEYSPEYFEQIVESFNDLAYIISAYPRNQMFHLIFAMPNPSNENKAEFLKRAAKHGMHVRKPSDMIFIPPQPLQPPKRKQTKDYIAHLYGMASPEEIVRIAKEFGFVISQPVSFQKGNAYITSARIIEAKGKGKELLEKCKKVSDKLGTFSVALNKGVKLVCTKVE